MLSLAGWQRSCRSHYLLCMSRYTHMIPLVWSCKIISWNSTQLYMPSDSTQTLLHRDTGSWTRPVYTQHILQSNVHTFNKVEHFPNDSGHSETYNKIWLFCFVVYGTQKCLVRYIVSINMCDCVQGWEQCVCLDMNVFYLGLVPEEERGRVDSLEPFDEYEVG